MNSFANEPRVNLLPCDGTVNYFGRTLLGKDKIIASVSFVIRVRAQGVSESPFGGPEALLEAFVGNEASDTELNNRAIQLQRRVTFSDSILGTFTFDRRLNWFAGRAVWNGHPVDLQLPTKESQVQATLRAAHALWGSQGMWNKRVRDYAVQALLPLKNEHWLEENEAEVTAEQFKERMTLESLTVYPGGSFEFWHNDGDLFCGHSIQISGSISKGPTGADIPE